ncbi:hypothetical protein KBY58_01790 [Cyanobium sp. HWJ4-Hawea]|uniref:hypothetical protein n=1 Tax=Cyanobium sp. HWJ4-Hawea TaxID=2823713 RepID=UPI0020CE426D|nr:hypothetical protein [Cyanobium sp. HWJ4-Hawea]MCP9808164.1 hypothetical protein [Cyanobium sp. HWJ4-Hawea]
MGKFQSIISSVAAIGTIVITVVAVYRGLDNQKQFNLKQQLEIQNLQKQLLEKQSPAPSQVSQPQRPSTELAPASGGQPDLAPLPPLPQANTP